jgi:hypothetical protein
MGVMQQVLSPGVEYGEKADFSSEMLGVASDGPQRFCCGPKENGIDDLFVLEGNRSQLFWNSKDNVVIGDGEKLCHARLQPFGSSQGLAFGTVAVAAGVVRVPLMAAAVALIQMTAQSGSSTDLDGAHGTTLIARHGSAVGLPVVRAALAEDIGHFQLRPDHLG